MVREVLRKLGADSFKQVIRRPEMDVFPWLGSRRARDTAPPELLICLRRIESRGAIERQLAHGERDEVQAAYNYAEYLPERRKMMQAWADYLDGLRAGANVIPIKLAG